MNQPFEARDNETRITGAVIVDAGRFAGIGDGLPKGSEGKSQEVADLSQRRLLRIERALGLNPICDH